MAHMNRRQFLRTGAVLGIGLGMSLPRLARMQDTDVTPESTAEGGVPMSLELTGAIKPVHDPVVIKADDAYYLFCTGPGIPIRRSADLIDWEIPFPPRVFGNVPEWAREAIPGVQDLWAPDVSYYNGRYQIYYSASTFGSNRSAIGLVTNATLDSDDEAYEWTDEGLVIESFAGGDYNAIDANFVVDAEATPWLAFGSHWSGIKMRRLDPETRKLSEEDTTLYSLAQRAVHPRAIEAPFIIRRGDFYYLFVSFDQCCQGVNSTYRVMVGRSEAITGPYVDRDGVPMMEDGGTQVTFPTERWRGPGHNSILQVGDVDYIAYHAYDAEANGVPTLRMDVLMWDDDGWPSIRTED